MFVQPCSMKTRRAPDKCARTAYDFSGVTNSKRNENFHLNNLAFEIEDDTGFENNMMQSKMKGTDWQFTVNTADFFFLSVRGEIRHDKGHSQAQVNESLTAAVYQIKRKFSPSTNAP